MYVVEKSIIYEKAGKYDLEFSKDSYRDARSFFIFL